MIHDFQISDWISNNHRSLQRIIGMFKDVSQPNASTENRIAPSISNSNHALISNLRAQVQVTQEQSMASVCCRICKKSFPSEEKLIEHETSHREKRYGKQYSCKTCGKLFSTPGYLETHQRLHSGKYHLSHVTSRKLLIHYVLY